jgi:hypothetical protein
MTHARILYQLMRADFLERVRRYSFLLTLAAAVYLGYSVFIGQTVLKLDTYRGVYNSAWTGSMMTLVTTTFLTLAGFYIVKNAIFRDELTRVGQVLATTPMSKAFYTLAKTLSNFAVLSAMVAVLATAAAILQLVRAEGSAVALGTLLAPFFWVALPAMAVIAALAVLWETLPLLRSGAGNVIYFFVWSFLLAGGVQLHWDDFAGFNLIGRNMQAALKAIDPTYNGSFTLGMGSVGEQTATKTFLWHGVHWTAGVIASRLLWVMAAVGLALLASIFFHRFDPARETSKKKASAQLPQQEPEPQITYAPARHLSPVLHVSSRTHFGRLVVSELRLMLQGRRWWWYAVALSLPAVSLFAPGDSAQGAAIAALIWPVLLWSQMGARETRHATSSMVFSSERALYRQLPAAWMAGVLVALMAGGGWLVRLLVIGNWNSLAAWVIGLFFIPSLALALGVWSGTSKPFEAIYTILWYAGPAHHSPGVDFLGTSAASTNLPAFSLAVVILLVVSYLGRRFQMAYA